MSDKKNTKGFLCFLFHAISHWGYLIFHVYLAYRAWKNISIIQALITLFIPIGGDIIYLLSEIVKLQFMNTIIFVVIIALYLLSQKLWDNNNY